MKRERAETPPIDYQTATDSECHSAAESDYDEIDTGNDAGPSFVHFPASSEWERTPAMREKKRRHQDELDATHHGDREQHIYETTLKGRDWTMCVRRVLLVSLFTCFSCALLLVFSSAPARSPPPAVQRGEYVPLCLRRGHQPLDALVAA